MTRFRSRRHELAFSLQQRWEINPGDSCEDILEEIREINVKETFAAPTMLPSDKVIEALEQGYHPQNPSAMHPADYITKYFELDGHEGLRWV